jgi:hypothetical protein
VLKFPVSRENTGNFINLGLGNPSTSTKRGVKSVSYKPIPYASEQGIFCGPTGNQIELSGKFGNSEIPP